MSTQSSANDKQVAGSHYQGQELQHWDIVRIFNLDYMQAQILRYVMRCKRKNGLEDLQKAGHVLQKYIEDFPVWLKRAAQPEVPGFLIHKGNGTEGEQGVMSIDVHAVEVRVASELMSLQHGFDDHSSAATIEVAVRAAELQLDVLQERLRRRRHLEKNREQDHGPGPGYVNQD